VHVLISPPSPADAEEFISAVRSSPGLRPWLDPPATVERFEAYLERAARDDHASYLIRHAQCGSLVGYANISNIVRGALQSGYLGYGGFASHAGRGLMTEGVGAVVQAAFDQFGLHRVEANIQPANLPSVNLARRLGFRREGFSPRYLMIGGDWRDHERWAVLADEFTRPLRHGGWHGQRAAGAEDGSCPCWRSRPAGSAGARALAAQAGG
jgi:[ribosomal protein S5]-alanine N-acetyltransferase